MSFLRSLYNRMSFVHYVGMVLLILNVVIFTDNLFSQIIQLIIIAVLVVHEWDEYANGRKLSKALSYYLKNMDNPHHYALDINTSIASEYDKIKSIINKREDIQKLKDVEDNLLIEDARKVISDIINGIYGNTIELSTSNEVLNNFKDEVNEMIIATRDNIGSINRVLQEYSNHNYTNIMKVPNIDKKSDIGLLVENVNNVQQSIVKILTDNKNNGTILRDNSSALRKSVQRLHSNSDESEASLKKTASSLKDITNRVRSDTENIVSMATLSSQVTDSGIIGQELATQTMSSMNEINEQVEAISEAVLIIDKISFQTKILSLNASVEAANTGEAGKGFAVVAQEVRALATKSSEASNEIKILVENATIKAKEGKKVSENMIKGYASLNNNISKTMKLISKIEASAKEQMLGIEQINRSIDTLSEQTKENANVAHQTHDIADQTDKLANIIVENMNTKKFISNLN